MSSGILISLAAEFTGKKAFNQAESSTSSLEKGAKKLAKALAAAFAADKVIAFGKASVKAFAEDEAAAVRLAKVVDNLGLGFANPQISDYIDNLTRMTGVADNELRPALQALLTTTGSLTTSQELLNLAIETSRGSGESLSTTAQDLANAYVGNTKGLKKYNLGLTQAELKTASFAEIQKKLTQQFSGSSAAYLDTYAGKMEYLKNRSAEAQEVIGKGLVDALIMMTSETGNVEDLANAFDDMATYLADAARGVGVVGKELAKLGDIPVLGALTKWSVSNTSILGILNKLGKNSNRTKSTGFSFFNTPAGNLSDNTAANDAAMKKAEADAAKRAKALADAQKKNTKALQDQAKIKQASAIFDLKQISIVAALKGNLSDEDRKRLELQMALETGNVAEAQRLTLELAKSQGLTDALAKTLASLPAASNPFAAWKGYLDEIELQAKRIAAFGISSSNTTPNPSNIPSGGLISDASGFAGIGMGSRGYNPLTGAIGAPTVIKLEVDQKVLAEVVQNQNNSGNSTGFSRLGDWRTI